MKQYKELTQRTDEWLQLKLGKISGSNVNKILSSYTEPQYYVDNKANQTKGIAGKLKNTPGFGEGAMTYAIELLTEKILQEPLPVFVSDAMMHGIEYEPYAREIYEQNMGVKVDEYGGFESDDQQLWYSPDGVVGEDGLIEIKCPQPIGHMRFLLFGHIKDDYYAQMQFGMMVSGRKWCDYVSFSPDFPDELKIMRKRVMRDEEYIANMQSLIEKFIEAKNELFNSLPSAQG